LTIVAAVEDLVEEADTLLVNGWDPVCCIDTVGLFGGLIVSYSLMESVNDADKPFLGVLLAFAGHLL
jgi:hypothetical protein